MDELPKHDRRISDSDVREIVAVINGMEKMPYPILSIRCSDDVEEGAVEVRTGVVRGPRSGIGHTIVLHRMDDGWRVLGRGGWRS